MRSVELRLSRDIVQKERRGSYIMAASSIIVLCWVLASVYLKVSNGQGCPCLGCGTDTISCTALGLTAFPDIPHGDRQLTEVLELDYNGLTSLSAEDFENFTSLLELEAIENNIHTFEPGIFANAPQLSIVELGNNPLVCDCRLRWLPSFLNLSGVAITGECSSPTFLSGTSLIDLVEADLLCDCEYECGNGVCDTSIGQCTCDSGYVGANCSSVCWPGTYGPGCQENCSCVRENEAFPCNHTTGECNCLPGFTGLLCEEECPTGYFGQECNEECQCQNGGLCNPVTGLCNCTQEWTGERCNISWCEDGVRNNDETDIDCGGSICLPCPVAQVDCRESGCEVGEVCLGEYRHPSYLPYPLQHEQLYQCVDEDMPGNAILQKFRDALRGREGALSDVNPNANLSVLEDSIQREIEIQFEIDGELDSVRLSTLEQARGDPLYQASIQWNIDIIDSNIERVITHINSGLLKGTILINREDRKVILNI